MTDQAKVAATMPEVLDLDPGTYYWCSCGRTDNQPYCDGSHVGTSFTPVELRIQKSQTVAFCMCRKTQNPPYCDGTHAHLDEVEETAHPSASASSPAEPHLGLVHALAKDGLSKFGHHGPMGAMGVPVATLPQWDDIQVLAAQLAKAPLLDGTSVGTELVIGPNAKKPLRLAMPLFVSDMSFGALSEEAKIALAKGAQGASTGICSGEGGMLAEEQQANSRYLYELASAQFGFTEQVLDKIQAFHFKAGQAAKTGVGGHLPGSKVTDKIAQVRGLEAGKDAISPARFKDLSTPEDFRHLSDEIREKTGGVPIGFKLSANHIEQDLQFALDAGADYVILDGRGGGTGAAPLILRDNISIPTIPALARARRFLDQAGVSGGASGTSGGGGEVTLIVTGGLRTPADFIKALCLGADGIALATSAMQALGCIAARICNTGNCPVGIATQQPELREKLVIETAAAQLTRFLESSTELMQVVARACGHTDLGDFNQGDLCTWKKEMADLSGIAFAGSPA